MTLGGREASGDHVAVLVLAAGSGRRLGLGPKAHLDLGGETFLSRVVGTCREAGLRAVYVVGSADDPGIGAATAALSARLVRNPDATRGMSSSVHVGLTAVASDHGFVATLVFPVDLPLVAAATAAQIAGAVTGSPWVWARPCFRGRGGHPVGLGRDVAMRVAEAGVETPLRDTLRVLGTVCVDLPCEDPGVLADVDDPEALAAVRAQYEALRERKSSDWVR